MKIFEIYAARTPGSYERWTYAANTRAEIDNVVSSLTVQVDLVVEATHDTLSIKLDELLKGQTERVYLFYQVVPEELYRATIQILQNESEPEPPPLPKRRLELQG